MIKRHIKALNVRDGKLYVTSGGQRMPLADFSGRIEIIEKQANVPVLGRTTKGMKKVYASFVVSEDIEYCRDCDINSAMVFDASGYVEKKDGCREQIIFAGLRLDDMDAVSGDICFEIPDLLLIKKLLKM